MAPLPQQRWNLEGGPLNQKRTRRLQCFKEPFMGVAAQGYLLAEETLEPDRYTYGVIVVSYQLAG